MLQIVYCLTGADHPPPILDRQLTTYVTKLRNELEDIIWELMLTGHPLASSLMETYKGLPDLLKIKFLLSPVGCEALLLTKASKSEQNVLNLNFSLSTATALPIHAVTSDWSSELPAPMEMTLGETITVDFGSAACRRVLPCSPVFHRPYENLTIDETNTVCKKLLGAFVEIEENCPSLSRLIRNYTRVIYIRKSGDLDPSSEQASNEIGGIRLRNPHLETYTQDQLVDDLVHESIHNFLATFEYLEAPFVRQEESFSSALRPVSPWSNRPLQLSSFIHAVFVYFGMYNYSKKKLQRSGHSPEEQRNLEDRINRHASGFLMPGQLSRYMSDLAEIDPPIATAINLMEKVVTTDYKDISM